MEDFAVNTAENNLPVENESSVSSPADNMNIQLVPDAADNEAAVTASHPVDKTGDEARCKVIDGVKYEWTDITREFVGACSGLELGELVHDSKYAAFNECHSLSD